MSTPNLSGQLGEMRFTLEVTRKDTGKVEVYEMIGKVMTEDNEVKENNNGSNS